MDLENVRKRLRVISVLSDTALSDFQRDIVLNVVNSDALDAAPEYEFTLHEVLDSESGMEFLIEGPGRAVGRVIATLQCCFPSLELRYLSYEWNCF